jgi:amino acid adenylation domain-containing protein
MIEKSFRLTALFARREAPMDMSGSGITKNAFTTSMVIDSDLNRLSILHDIPQEYDQNRLTQDLFAIQANTTPDAIALVAEDQTLRYRELNCRANQLAHLLQALGVQPNTCVGICVERSPALVIGLLGIFKAGGAYVPLDPDYPPARLAFILKDTRPLVVITQQRMLTRLSIEGAHVICLDGDAVLLSHQDERNPPHSAVSTDLAYVVYTSGSTGQPKGALVPHSNLLNLVFWHQQAFSVIASDRATQLASPAFDVAGWELWPYLTIGASVHFIDQEVRAAPVLLRDWLVNHHITITCLPTALAESVISLPWPATTSLRLLLTGGDTLHRYPSSSLPFELINSYGLTETTVVSTFGKVHPTETTDLPPSIGRPVSNTQIYILDEQLRPVPIGIPGELCVGGVGVGRGYLNRPELTTQKFIANPFVSHPSVGAASGAYPKPDTLLYKTGDLACIRPDGQIQFMGRIDQQIKIRGYRIEPNEIMTALNRLPAIETSVVVAREETPGDKKLVAYIVLKPEGKTTAGTLREALATSLPPSMIPATFVCLSDLPVTPNGKVDRAALPEPEVANTLPEGESITTPGSPIEERVASIIASLLGVQQIGVNENFFLLGGHSLLGTQIIMHLHEAFGVEISLRTFFDAPTVRLLSTEIGQQILAKLESMADEEALGLL